MLMPMDRWASILTGLAALLGAAGVAEAAYAAHGSADPLIATSSHFLMLHAAAIIALSAFAQTRAKPKALLISATVLLCGTLLFCGDLSYHVFRGERLFPMAAPTGGSLQILGWLTAALSAVFSGAKRA